MKNKQMKNLRTIELNRENQKVFSYTGFQKTIPNSGTDVWDKKFDYQKFYDKDRAGNMTNALRSLANS